MLVVYRTGSKLANADCLNRLSMLQSVPTPPVRGDTIMLQSVPNHVTGEDG